MEAFSDGVIAILITIMVLELHVPDGAGLRDFAPAMPHLLIYALSFVFLGIYWNNHHHLLQAARTVSGAILWANLHLLFWLSLVPFTTAYMGLNGFAALPTAVYGINLLLAAAAYTILQSYITTHHGEVSPLKHAVGNDRKGKASVALYIAGVAVAWWYPSVALAFYSAVALLWLVPDKRIELALVDGGSA